jgi:hypothetical protein
MRWFEVLSASRELREEFTMGPKTNGGQIVQRAKEGFSFSTNSQAAFSANVLPAFHGMLTILICKPPRGLAPYLDIRAEELREPLPS